LSANGGLKIFHLFQSKFRVNFNASFAIWRVIFKLFSSQALVGNLKNGFAINIKVIQSVRFVLQSSQRLDWQFEEMTKRLGFAKRYLKSEVAEDSFV